MKSQFLDRLLALRDRARLAAMSYDLAVSRYVARVQQEISAEHQQWRLLTDVAKAEVA